MNEQRFILDDDGEYIKDTKTGDLWDACGGGDGVPMLIARVNKLEKENKFLKDILSKNDISLE